MPNRQTRRPTGKSHSPESGAGLGVDAFGGPAIDPTENVLSLVDAESKYQNGMREGEARFQNAMREAETRRLNELASQKQTFDLELARVLRANQDASSMLLATQLKEVKTDVTDRTAKLEQFRWETGGRTSVSDPATAEALEKLAAAVSGLKAGDETSKGRNLGRNDVIGWAVAAAVVGGLVAKLLPG